MLNGLITYHDREGREVMRENLPAIHRAAERLHILSIFKERPEIKHIETNVRRYTAADIYGGCKGQKI